MLIISNFVANVCVANKGSKNHNELEEFWKTS
jgi:hypothetical protein